MLDAPFNLLEGAHFDLADAFARDAKLIGELLERDRLVGEAARFEDAPLAIVEHAERLAERLVPIFRLLGFGEQAFLAGAVVDQPIHPLAGVAVFSRIGAFGKRAAEPRSYRSHPARHAQPLGDQLHLIRPHLAFVERGDAALRPFQVEDSFFSMAMVPIFTSDHERRIYPWITA